MSNLHQENIDDVRCRHCGGRYNLGKVEVVGRYADCTVFTAPCCGRAVDDRRWKFSPDFDHENGLAPDRAEWSRDGTLRRSG